MKRDNRFESLGSLGAYQKAIEGMGPYRAVYAEDEDGNKYELGGIKLENRSLTVYIKKI